MLGLAEGVPKGYLRFELRVRARVRGTGRGTGRVTLRGDLPVSGAFSSAAALSPPHLSSLRKRVVSSSAAASLRVGQGKGQD